MFAIHTRRSYPHMGVPEWLDSASSEKQSIAALDYGHLKAGTLMLS